MQTLYRKYRPQDFSEVFGQVPIVNVIKKQVGENKVGHAYLFTGPRGTGKTSMARLLAKAVNCNSQKEGNPCKKCISCKAIEQGKFLDLIEIDAASNRGIDEIRRLKERVSFSPSEGKKKVYIIDEVHMLTKDAFNALLKTLEEPPEHVIFILATTEPHKIPMTIISRCQRFNFNLASDDVVIKRLEYVCKKEGVNFEKEALLAIVRNSGGSFRDSESILEKVLGAVGVKNDNKVDLKDVREILGLAEDKEVVKFVESLISKDAKKALKVYDTFINSGVDIFQFIRQALEYCRQLLISKVTNNKDQFKLSDLVKIITELADAERNLKSSQVRRLPVELAIIKICTLENEDKVQVSTISNKNNETKKDKKKIVKIVKDAIDSIPGSNKDDVSLSKVKENWSKIIDLIRPYNHHLSAFFKKGAPVEIKGAILTLEVPFRFHKQRIESQKGQQAFGEVSNKLFGKSLKCSCEVVEEESEEKVDLVIENNEVVLEVLGDIIE